MTKISEQIAIATLSIFLKSRKWDGGLISDKNITTFIQKWIRCKNRKLKIKPYIIDDIIWTTILAIDKLQEKILLNQKSLVKVTAKRCAMKIFGENLYRAKRAKPITPENALKIIENLLQDKSNWWSKCAAICFAITICTGARMIDTTRLYWEDIFEEENNSGAYIVIPLRISKSNQLAKRSEQLTFKKDENNIIKLDDLLDFWKKFSNSNGKGLIFNAGEKISTQKLVGYISRRSKKLGLGQITGHSGRYTVLSALFEHGIDDSSKKLFMHWSPGSEMPLHYRSTMLETSKIGACYNLSKNNYNKTKI
jgi:integrase